MSDMCKCLKCGSIYPWKEVRRVTIYEDYGDVDCPKCPKCGRIEYDGMDYFIVDADESDKED